MLNGTAGAGNRTIPHHKNEWVDVDMLPTTYRLYAATAMYFYVTLGSEGGRACLSIAR